MASLSQGRTAAAQCGLFTYNSVPVIFEPTCICRNYVCHVKWDLQKHEMSRPSVTVEKIISISYLLITWWYFLTHSMEQSPTWEANRLSVKKFPVFYGTRKFITAFTKDRHLSLPWAKSFHFLKIHLNIILPFKPGSSKWSLSLRFLHQKPCMHLSSSPYVLHCPPISFFSNT